jgi:hypothetical protein
MTRGKSAKRAMKLHLESRERERKAKQAELKSKQIGGNAKTRWGRAHEWRSTGVHCCGVTKTGARCTSVTLFPNCFCARHQKQTSVDRGTWCVEGRPKFTPVSRPGAAPYTGALPDTPPRAGRGPPQVVLEAEVLVDNDAVEARIRRELQLPLPIGVTEERVGALDLDDLHFLS